jgi:PPOX class probable F420-dependent enzyme
MATLDDEQVRFLEQPFVGVVTTLREDGSPHNTVVWLEPRGGALEFNTAYGRAKPRHLERDARVALTVVDPRDSYRWLSVTGRAELVDEGADEQIDRLAKKYLGADSYPFRKPEERRVTVRIRPEKVEAYGIG